MTASSPLILAIGDSLIAGYGLSAAQSFPAQLERRLRPRHPGVRVINAGVSGDTTEDLLRRLPRVLFGLGQLPALGIIQVGPNDVIRQVPPAKTRANLSAILTELARCGFPVLLTTVEPPAFLRHRATAYIDIHANVALAHGATILPFFPAGILGRPDMVIGDRVHPDAQAIALVVEAMLSTIEHLI